jgi:hypothetical protein
VRTEQATRSIGAASVSGPEVPPTDAPMPDAQALIEEARRLHRRRRLHRAGVVAASAATAAVLAGGVIALTTASRPAPTTHAPARRPQPAAAAPTMPAEVVVWHSNFSLAVVSSRTGMTERTLVLGVAEDRGLPALSVAGGFVYYDNANGPTSQVLRVPVGGGTPTVVAPGRLPAVSANGEWLAYGTDTSLSGGAESIVVTNLVTGVTRTWSFTSSVPDIAALSWSPDNVTLSFTATAAAEDGRTSALSTRLLDVATFSGPLDDAPVLALGPGLQWAGYLSAHTGVAARTTAHGVTLLEVSTASAVGKGSGSGSGKVIRRLVTLSDSLLTANALDGTEGTIQADPSGHDLLIAATPPAGGSGTVVRYTLGSAQPVALVHGGLRAAWVG